MRIIAGEYRSRQIQAPRGESTRPIPDRVKESLFGMLGANCAGAGVLDLFAGSGSIGLEALSRGASRCVFVEKDKHAVAALEANIAALGCADRAEVVRGDALGSAALARAPRPLDLVFLDPPYPLVESPGGWARVRRQAEAVLARLSPTGFLVLRTPWPFLVAEGGAARGPGGVSGAGAGGSGPGGRRGRREVWVDPQGERMERYDEYLEQAQREGLLDAREPVRVRADLALAGGRGPETHVYRHTAVHLYVRGDAAGA